MYYLLDFLVIWSLEEINFISITQNHKSQILLIALYNRIKKGYKPN